jgi:hypothetical protein
MGWKQELFHYEYANFSNENATKTQHKHGLLVVLADDHLASTAKTW